MTAIELLPVADVDPACLEALAPKLSRYFRTLCRIRPGGIDPVFAFDAQRGQYHSTAILQYVERLANGNTVIFSSTGGTKREDRPSIIQALEVTPDKKLVWVLQDWKNLGPATTAQFLDQPGIPEKPGDLQR